MKFVFSLVFCLFSGFVSTECALAQSKILCENFRLLNKIDKKHLSEAYIYEKTNEWLQILVIDNKGHDALKSKNFENLIKIT